MRRAIVLLAASLITLTAGAASAQNNAPRNLILFIPDGLRGRIVTPQSALTRPSSRQGRQLVEFAFVVSGLLQCMVNGSAIASGNRLGDTGTFSNTIYTPAIHRCPPATPSSPLSKNDAVLGDIDEHFNGDYLNEETILKMARAQGFRRLPSANSPTLLFDHTDRGKNTIVIDDPTGGKNGVPGCLRKSRTR